MILATYNNKWLSSDDPEDRKLYARLNREAKTEVTKSKNKMWEDKCERLNRLMGGTRVTEAWKTVKNIRQDVREQVNKPLISLEIWERYFSELLKENRREFLTENLPMDINENYIENIDRITSQEIKKTIKSMKNGKSAGPGDIPVELIKHGPPLLWELLADLMNKCIIEGEDPPREWNLAYLSTIHKKGDRTICGNYRGISVLGSIGRLYGKIIKNRVEVDFTDIEEQSGFRAGRSCVDNIFSLRQVIEKRSERNLSTHLIFIDLEKAYDNVPLSKLFNVLDRSDISKAYVRAIFNLYKNAKCAVKRGKHVSETIKITKGLKQGCSLSPTLFKIYIQESIKEWTRKCAGMGIEINDACLYTLLFADDQILIANDEDDVTYMLRKLIDEYTKWGLRINFNKTQYLCIGEQPRNIRVDSGIVRHCTEYKYLGSIISQERGSQYDIENRIKQGKMVIRQLNGLLWSPKITKGVKRNLYRAIVEPIATYGAECWQITKKFKNKLQALEMDHLRRSCRISRLEHIPNARIRELTGVKSTITDRIEQRQLSWYGHVMRMEGYRWPKRCMEYNPQHRRKRGRPKQTWKKGIMEAMERRGLQEGDWLDRVSWRMRCEMR